MNAPREPDTFYIAPAYSDSIGHSAIPANAVFVGSRSAVMERILDSKARRAALAIINDAEHARGTLLEIRKRERELDRREAAVSAREHAVTEAEAAILQDAIRKLDATKKRMDEEEARRVQAQIDAMPDPDDPTTYLQELPA
jgi:hypothetical protein